MVTERNTLLNQIRLAIQGSNKTQYRIAQETGISRSQLSRLMHGERGLSIEALEKLAESLNLEILVQSKNRKKRH
jgi:transcriptional regulator with XRE-family HTH domain